MNSVEPMDNSHIRPSIMAEHYVMLPRAVRRGKRQSVGVPKEAIRQGQRTQMFAGTAGWLYSYALSRIWEVGSRSSWPSENLRAPTISLTA